MNSESPIVRERRGSSKIALGSIFIECNHFGGVPADIETFRRTQLDFGIELMSYDSGTVGGILYTLREHATEVVPLLSASACPSRSVASDCYSFLKSELLGRLRDSLPVDGVLLALHGAAAADNAGDMEGDLLADVRSVVGDVPVVATLDLHAHVTQKMVTNADALIAWETYPHADAWETGVRGATALLDIISGRLQPAMVMAKAPVLVSGVNGHTEAPGPFADVMARAKEMEQLEGVYSTSAFLVHPYLDLPDMGGGGLVITNGDPARAEQLASELAQLYWQRRFDLEPEVLTPADAIDLGLQEDGLVVLVETSDCCGGGAAGDSVCTLSALLEWAPDQVALVPVVDPAAAAKCHEAGEGNQITIRLGHALDPQWGTPIDLSGLVVTLSDGSFLYRGGIWDGVSGNMGPSAVVQVEGIHVLIASQPTYEWCGEQFESLGLDVTQAKFVVAKNPMNYRPTYSKHANAMFILDTPGPTPPTLKHVEYQHLQRPYFPRDEHIANWQPVVLK